MNDQIKVKANTSKSIQAEADRIAEEQRKAAEAQAEADRIAEEQRKAAEAQAEADRIAEEQRKAAEASLTEIPALFISSRGDSFRRCGFRFTKDPLGIALECLTEEQIEILKAEPNLEVEEGTALLDELQVVEIQ